MDELVHAAAQQGCCRRGLLPPGLPFRQLLDGGGSLDEEPSASLSVVTT